MDCVYHHVVQLLLQLQEEVVTGMEPVALQKQQKQQQPVVLEQDMVPVLVLVQAMETLH